MAAAKGCTAQVAAEGCSVLQWVLTLTLTLPLTLTLTLTQTLTLTLTLNPDTNEMPVIHIFTESITSVR